MGLKYPICRELLQQALVTYLLAGKVTGGLEGDWAMLLEELHEDGFLDDQEIRAVQEGRMR